MTRWRYRQDQERPPFAATWESAPDEVIDFSADHTFTVKLVDSVTGDVALTKTTGIVGYPTVPNVVVYWGVGELNITPGTYAVHLIATNTAGEDRRFMPGREPYIEIGEAV